MNARARQPSDLPSVAETRAEFGATLPALPLRAVPHFSQGVLNHLPDPPPGRIGWPWTVETPPPSPGTWPLISIVTPAFQHGRYLEETIRSVLLQNYPNLEYVVIDGGSTDETAAILQKYRPWLSFARSARDRGQGHAINLGFALASGTLRGWLNSDDFYLPHALEALAEASRSAPADFFYGDGLDLREDTGVTRYALAPFAHARYRHFGGLLFSHAAFWRDTIHEPVWEAMRCNVDGELWQRLLPARKLHYIPQALGLVRVQPEAKTVHPRYRTAWAQDDAAIWAIHGRPPGPRNWRRYEFRYVQRFVASRRARLAIATRRRVLDACAWPQPVALPHE